MESKKKIFLIVVIIIMMHFLSKFYCNIQIKFYIKTIIN